MRLFGGAADPDCMFMEDNAKLHRNHIVDDFLEETNIRHMNNPSWSPDLNPIELLKRGLFNNSMLNPDEHFWMILKGTLYSVTPHSRSAIN